LPRKRDCGTSVRHFQRKRKSIDVWIIIPAIAGIWPSQLLQKQQHVGFPPARE
jgi:hypothetical protein